MGKLSQLDNRHLEDMLCMRADLLEIDKSRQSMELINNLSCRLRGINFLGDKELDWLIQLDNNFQLGM